MKSGILTIAYLMAVGAALPIDIRDAPPYRLPPYRPPRSLRRSSCPRHQDDDYAAYYRDQRRARKLRACLCRGETISAEASAWLARWEQGQP